LDKKRSIHIVAVGSLHTIIIDNLSNVYTFGINDEGQLGFNNRQNQPTPRLVENTETLFKADAATLLSKGPAPKLSIEEVCCGNDHTLIRTGFGRVFGWGGNRRGQLGVGNFEYCGKPKVISSLKNVKKISCGAFHSSCIVDPGLLYVWGAAECLGQETPVVDGTKDASVPLRLFIEKSKRVYNVCCGEFQTIASCSTGVYSWGSNKHGELGIGDKNSRIVPTKVILPEMTDLQLQSASISTGGKHIAYTVDGSLWIWGWNKYGQLGNGSTYDLLKPALVQIPSSKAIAMTMCSRKSTTVLLHSGEIYMFGLSTPLDTFSPGRGSIPVLHPTLICSKTVQEKYCSLDIISSGSMSVISVDVVDLSLPAAPPSPLKSSSKVRAFDNVYQTESIKEISFTLKPDDVQSELSKQMGKMMIGKVTNSKTKTTATTSPLPSQERIPRFFKKKDDKIKVPEVVVRRNTIKAKRRELEKNVSRDDYFALFNPLISLKGKKNENEEKIME
jgi:alpha-tubulin suppressor-like RCC1 family protein